MKDLVGDQQQLEVPVGDLAERPQRQGKPVAAVRVGRKHRPHRVPVVLREALEQGADEHILRNPLAPQSDARDADGFDLPPGERAAVERGLERVRESWIRGNCCL